MKLYYFHKLSLFIMIVFVMYYYVSKNSGCLQEERTGLLELKKMLESNGTEPPIHLGYWTETSQTDCCEWDRVTCDSNTRHVTQLFLSNLNYISMESFYDRRLREDSHVWSINCSLFLPFTDLKSLNLSYNSFAQWEKKHGFEKLSALEKLEILDLSHNEFEDKNIYHSLGAITSLKTLLLGDNQLGGSFPANELFGLENLETLDLSFSNYEDWQPKEGFEKLRVFKKLETLNFKYNSLIVEMLPYLNKLSSLKVLNLGGNKFDGSFPAYELGNLTNLESLILSGCSGLTGIEGLERFKNLTSLDISNNYRFNRTLLFQSLSQLTSLKNLFLAGTLLSGDPFPAKELSVLENLEMLDLSWNEFSSLTVKDFELLSKLKKMSHLDLSGNRFGKGVFRILDAIPSLRFLSLKYNYMKGTISNQDLTYNRSRLEVLLLSDNRLNGSLPVEGLASLRYLEVLDLEWNDFFGSIPSSIGDLSSLKVLSLKHNQLNGSLPDQGTDRGKAPITE